VSLLLLLLLFSVTYNDYEKEKKKENGGKTNKQIKNMHASPTARNFFLVLISNSPVHSPSFLFSFFKILSLLALPNAVSRVGDCDFI